MNVSHGYHILVVDRLLTGGCTVEVSDDVRRVDESVDSVDEVVKRVMVDVEDDVEDDSVDVVKSVMLVELELDVVSSGRLVVDDVVSDDDDDDDDVVVNVVDVVDELVNEVVDEVDEGALSLYENQSKSMH